MASTSNTEIFADCTPLEECNGIVNLNEPKDILIDHQPPPTEQDDHQEKPQPTSSPHLEENALGGSSSRDSNNVQAELSNTVVAPQLDPTPKHGRGSPSTKVQEPKPARSSGRPRSKDQRPSWLPSQRNVRNKTRQNGASVGHVDKVN